MVKLLSNAEYAKLVSASKEDSTNTAIKKLQEQHSLEIKKYQRELEDTQRKMEILKEDNLIALNRKNEEIAGRIQQATEQLKEKNAQITMERNNFQKEVEILTKAFENLGFDVKDMKGILDKLVDGIIAKNEIKLVK